MFASLLDGFSLQEVLRLLEREVVVVTELVDILVGSGFGLRLFLRFISVRGVAGDRQMVVEVCLADDEGGIVAFSRIINRDIRLVPVAWMERPDGV